MPAGLCPPTTLTPCAMSNVGNLKKKAGKLRQRERDILSATITLDDVKALFLNTLQTALRFISRGGRRPGAREYSSFAVQMII